MHALRAVIVHTSNSPFTNNNRYLIALAEAGVDTEGALIVEVVVEEIIKPTPSPTVLTIESSKNVGAIAGGSAAAGVVFIALFFALFMRKGKVRSSAREAEVIEVAENRRKSNEIVAIAQQVVFKKSKRTMTTFTTTATTTTTTSSGLASIATQSSVSSLASTRSLVSDDDVMELSTVRTADQRLSLVKEEDELPAEQRLSLIVEEGNEADDDDL